MNRQRTLRWGWLLLAPVLLAAGCGGDDAPEPPPSPPAADPTAVTTAEPTAEPTGAAGAGLGASGPVDACALLAEAELSDVFAGTVPEPGGVDWGEGVAECVWEQSERQLVGITVVSAETLQTDFIDQMNVAGEVEELGPGAVWFPGRVGILAFSSAGATTGFTVGEYGVLVAVVTGDRDQQAADLARATDLSTLVGQRLG